MRRRGPTTSHPILFLFTAIALTSILALLLIFLIRRHKSNISAQESQRREFLAAPPPQHIRAKSKKIFKAFREGDDEKLTELLASIDPEIDEEEYLKVLYDHSQLTKPHLAHLAISAARPSALKIILESNLVDGNDLGFIHHAIKNLKSNPRQLDILNLILECKADLDRPDRNGNPPIAVAINYTNPVGLRFLIANRAKVNVPFAHSPSFLHHAIKSPNGNIEIVQELLLSSANVYHYGPDGRTAFHHALTLRPYNSTLIDLFLSTHPPNLDASRHHSHLINFPTSPKEVQKATNATRYGYSPLHIAVASYNVKLVQFLLERGADRSRRDTSGLTPLQLSEKLKHPKITAILK